MAAANVFYCTCNNSLSFQSAAALCIGAGSFSDPDDIPGLAHFLEHSKLELISHY